MRTSAALGILSVILPAALLLGGAGCSNSSSVKPAVPPAPVEGVALILVYDTSGSMSASVPDAAGKPAPKYEIAQRATLTIVDQLAAYRNAAPPDAPRRLEAGLVITDNSRSRTIVPLGPFHEPPFQSWLRDFNSPRGSTPLGLSLREAARQLLASGLTRKHILVITDGENTSGPEPAPELASLQEQAASLQAHIGVYFVAFDVKASVFDSVKSLGADIFSAADEQQLKEQFDVVLQEKILLENEEP